MPSWRTPLVSALALTLGLTPIAPVVAAPASIAPALAQANAGSAVVQVGGRHHRHHRHHHRHHGHIGVGIGLGIIGGIIAADAYRPTPGYYYDDEDYDGPYYAPPGYSGDPRKLCAQSFRSFEWKTGLYTTYAGEKKLCPYLR